MVLVPTLESGPFILLLVAIAAYLLGSIPFGILVARAFGLPDPRTIGSKNIGATNMLRTGSKPAALATVLLDGAKGGIAVIIARALFAEDAAQFAGLAAFFGHLYPVFLKFKGGKGVATLLGTVVGLAPFIGLIALLAWLFAYFVFRYSSLSALMSAAVTPPIAIMLGFEHMALVLFVMAIMVFWRHRENIKRLQAGTEPMVDWGKKKNE
ncbi:MAG: glycerol-3-phosphate 1-O-acyltransferase PlsY [Silicimonas sp.]|nr:glycerol-3-phosphate 1-O-acyltransferase PlsY [Silicimonas sp.]